MFQSFDDKTDSSSGSARAAALRCELKRRGLAAFLVPRSDEYQNEYVPPCAERLRWLTGFDGSAGMAILTEKTAVLFVDGRYTLQAPKQVNTRVFKILKMPENMPVEWLKKVVRKKDVIGYDPRLHSIKSVQRLEKIAEKRGARLAPQPDNPIDAIWENRPAPPRNSVRLHPIEYAGVPAAKKIAAIRKDLKRNKADATVLSMPESIAWLLNIRGQDVPHIPVPLSFAIVPAKGKSELFIDPRKLPPDVRRVLKQDVYLRNPDALAGALNVLGGRKAKVQLDPESASQWFAEQLTQAGAEVIHAADPCLLPKAKKNRAEIKGMRSAHRRDAAPMCRFLAWIDANAASGKLDEIGAARKLEALRAETGQLRDISFDTISGAGANGAIVHYRVTKKSNAVLKPGSLYLVDSGAQYPDGTTDITRTVAIGKPTAGMRRHFTLVLKGHIAVASARFPKGTRGADLDPLARNPLWHAGLDFDHGTGHGVGSYLSVHEGPQRISKLGTARLEPGMILSNEPGYYRKGKYGIRIENLVLTTPARKVKGGERPMMGFETLTLVPIDRRLIDAALLDEDERKWINGYHARVRREIGASLVDGDKAWLMDATAPLEAA